MCLSAEVDLVAGLVISSAGIDALRHAEDRKAMSVAALPVVLGAHQIVEAVAWWSLEGRVAATAGEVAVWTYLLVAFGVLPIYVPLAIAALEPDRLRKRTMLQLAVLGAVVASALVVAMIRGPVEAAIGCRYIAYSIDLRYGGVLVAGYVAATCGALLLSGHRIIVRFGVLNIVAVSVLALLNTAGFASLWCAWAAIASLGIAFRFRHGSFAATQPRRMSRPLTT